MMGIYHLWLFRSLKQFYKKIIRVNLVLQEKHKKKILHPKTQSDEYWWRPQKIISKNSFIYLHGVMETGILYAHQPVHAFAIHGPVATMCDILFSMYVSSRFSKHMTQASTLDRQPKIWRLPMIVTNPKRGQPIFQQK